MKERNKVRFMVQSAVIAAIYVVPYMSATVANFYNSIKEA